ncbi:RDD family protein [Bacillus massilinigeriensis]|uniref:RDD family protein n=1 Tax=Bacillus mediterraneensis TaxID=1805474 RepID=UPI0009F603F6
MKTSSELEGDTTQEPNETVNGSRLGSDETTTAGGKDIGGEVSETVSPIPLVSKASQIPEEHGRYAGFWMRFWAYLTDLIIIWSLNGLLIYPILRGLGISTDKDSLFDPATVLTAIIFYLYFVLMTKYLGQTLGKMLFGLKVVDLKGERLSWGTVLFREWIGRFISITVLLGYVIVAFLPKKQGLHDLFADTTVVHEA